MRLQRKNKQKMYYSIPGIEVEVYDRNSDGTIKYIDVDGEQVPIVLGKKLGYSEPQEFYGVISGKTNKIQAEMFGIDPTDGIATIVLEKDAIPLAYEMKIWKNSEIAYKDDGTLDVESSDYTVKDVLDEYLDFDWLLLQRNIKGVLNG